MKKIIIVLLMPLIGLITLTACRQKTVDVEDYIVGQLVSREVSKKYEPVMLYRTKDFKKNYHAGVGTIVSSPAGRKYLLTVEHLFQRNHGTQYFLTRSLKPYQDYISGDRGVIEVSQKGKEVAVSPYISATDVAMLEIGAPKPIECFSEFSEGISYRDNEKFGMQPIQSKFLLRSLISDKSYQVLLWSDNEKGSKLYVIPYASLPGESGTGFIDENENLYVLKGSLDDIKISQGVLKTPIPKGGCSMLIGPFNFKPRD
jgi:hypothetical protein